jgi:hypothetical protein
LIPQKRKISSPENGIVRCQILNRKSSENDEDGKTKKIGLFLSNLNMNLFLIMIYREE